MSTALQQVASRLSVSADELQSIVMNTVMPNGGRGVTNEQFISFMAVANEYKLNPLIKEIYAFPAKGGGIQPIVSIDGWLKIINTHPDFDGLVHEDILDANGAVVAIKCTIYKKNTKHPVVVTEYMSECHRGTEPWQKWPIRMLRHKATIQCGRYAFGISGIIDPDEAERFQDAGAIPKEKDITPKADPEPTITEDQKQELIALTEKTGGSEDHLKAWLGFDDLMQLPVWKFENAMKSLKKRAEDNAKKQSYADASQGE